MNATTVRHTGKRQILTHINPLAVLAAAVALAVVAVTIGCSKPGYVEVDSEGFGITSDKPSLEAYRDRTMQPIQIEPGNRNRNLSWNTLYDNMPGDYAKYEEVAQPAVYTRDGAGNVTGTYTPPPIRTKIKDATSTKKAFEKWAADPVGLRARVEAKFNDKLHDLLKNKTLKQDVLDASVKLSVDPVAILACILGEHTFNVDMYDDIQQYARSALLWAGKWASKFEANGVDLADLIKLPEFKSCNDGKNAGGSHALYWNCVAEVWNTTFAGKRVGKVSYPSGGFKWVFFNPLSTGYSYGLGQLDPIRALMVTDLVNRYTGRRIVTVDDPRMIYEDIIDPTSTVYYIAANVRLFTDTYKQVAGFDISKNIGVIASLYNLGAEGGRAAKLYVKNVGALQQGKTLVVPVENYYGFVINEREAVLRKAWAAGKF